MPETAARSNALDSLVALRLSIRDAAAAEQMQGDMPAAPVNGN